MLQSAIESNRIIPVVERPKSPFVNRGAPSGRVYPVLSSPSALDVDQRQNFRRRSESLLRILA